MPWGPKWNQQSSFILKSGSPLIQVKAVEAAKKSTSSSPPQWAPSAKQMLLNGIICLFLQTPTTANDRNFIYFVVRKLENFFELRTFYFTINSILETSIVKASELKNKTRVQHHPRPRGYFSHGTHTVVKYHFLFRNSDYQFNFKRPKNSLFGPFYRFVGEN